MRGRVAFARRIKLGTIVLLLLLLYCANCIKVFFSWFIVNPLKARIAFHRNKVAWSCIHIDGVLARIAAIWLYPKIGSNDYIHVYVYIYIYPLSLPLRMIIKLSESDSHIDAEQGCEYRLFERPLARIRVAQLALNVVVHASASLWLHIGPRPSYRAIRL